jgi:hypothetical protein
MTTKSPMPAFYRLRRSIPLILAIVALFTAASADARYKVGISDQKAATFSHPNFGQLKIRYARLIVPWDFYRVGWELGQTDAWLGAARAHGVRPFVTFAHSWVSPRRRPGARQFRRTVREFRKRYPWVREFAPWNEANHRSQPTYKRPRTAATYYNVLRKNCRGCTIVALDVLDQPGMTRYVRKFKRFARGRPRIWGLHNYSDTNRYRSRGTRALLRVVRGSVWLTETGGVVKFADSFRYSEARAARATKYMFRLARSNRRIKRLYIYCWWGEPRGARFDAGLVGPDGSPRRAYYVVKNKLR